MRDHEPSKPELLLLTFPGHIAKRATPTTTLLNTCYKRKRLLDPDHGQEADQVSEGMHLLAGRQACQASKTAKHQGKQTSTRRTR